MAAGESVCVWLVWARNQAPPLLGGAERKDKPRVDGRVPPFTLQGSALLLRSCVCLFFSPAAESFEVSAQIGSGVVRGGPEEGSTRVAPGFHQSSMRVLQGFHEVLRGLKRAPHAVGDITKAFVYNVCVCF